MLRTFLSLDLITIVVIKIKGSGTAILIYYSDSQTSYIVLNVFERKIKSIYN